MKVTSDFRSDIEALRAIAVVAVVLFHARVPGFSGGFCGVDIFFVISGYLITGLLVRESAPTHTIDLLAFWTRRAWRLLPNALVVFCATLVAMRALLPAIEHDSIGRDVVAALAYVANYHFAGRALDYFDHAQTTSPVLHFWSLSVEEQFYFFFPCLLIAITTIVGPLGRGRLLILVATVLTASLAAALVWMRYSQPNAFFNTEARIWELAMGGLVLLLKPRFDAQHTVVRTTIALAGLAGIAASIIVLDDRMPYPGVLALLPVVATALLIGAGLDPRSVLGRTSATTPLQWIGRRSYSIYLWHWPILIFATPYAPQTPLGTLALLVAILVASAIAFAWVEDPLRHLGSGLWRPRTSLPILVSASVAVALGAYVLSKPQWLHGKREQARIAKVVAAKADMPNLVKPGCEADPVDPTIPVCRYGASDSTKRVVLFGDSYARQYFDGMDTAARNAGWSLEVRTKLDCPPIEAETRDRLRGVSDTACDQWRAATIDRFLKDPPALVVISSWLGVANHFMQAKRDEPVDRKGAHQIWSRAFAALLQRLRDGGVSVAVVRTTPRGNFANLQSCLSGGPEDQCARPRREAFNVGAIDIESAAGVAGVRIVDLTDRFCGPNVCYSQRNGMIVYRDKTHHITSVFSRSLAPDFEAMLRSTGRL